MTETEKIFKQNLIYLREKHQISGYRVAKETGIKHVIPIPNVIPNIEAIIIEIIAYLYQDFLIILRFSYYVYIIIIFSRTYRIYRK